MSYSRKKLIWFCNSMATMLDAGLPVTRALTVTGRQAGGGMRSGLARVLKGVEKGSTLAEAMGRERGFPDLLVQLVRVGETSGTLERTIAEAGRYYEFQQQLWRSFLSGIAWPAFQYIIAVAVVAFTFTVLAGLGNAMGDPRMVLGLGYGIPVLVVFLYVFMLRPLGGTRPVHELLLRIPVIRSVSLNLALARLSLLMHLMTEAGVPLMESVREAMRGTANATFDARGDRVARTVECGGSLTDGFAETRLFPREYLEVMAVAEESGKLSERFAWLARHYAERASGSLKALNRVAGVLVWILVAAVIVTFIFKIFSQYVGSLNQALP